MRRPRTARERTAVVKASAKWLARAVAVQSVRRARLFLAVIEATGWIDYARPHIDAYRDAPRLLHELHDSVADPARGYDIHHIVEKASAAEDGLAGALINARENRVRISTLKHWEITAWYMTRNQNYDYLSPREYLRGKDWVERRKVGLDALIKTGVLKP